MFEALKAAKRLTEVEDGMSRMDRRLTALEVQWGDTLDRLKTMMGRLYKERTRQDRVANYASPEGPANLSDEDVAAGISSLSPRQQEISAQIMARRRRGTQ